MKVEKVAKQSGGAFVTVRASGPWTLSLEFPGETAEWARLSRTEGSGDAYDIVLNYDENDTESDRSLNIILMSGKKTDVWTLVQTCTSGSDSPDGPDAVPGWMELPAVSQNLEYYNHSFTMNGREYRNYSFGWDKGALAAHWVAYPLCRMYTVKNVERTDAWDCDPKLSESDQPIMYKGLGSGYDRGHQCPSADRVCCEEANVQTFYFTNMTPQNSGLNQRIWANFENKVRSISGAADTLYVVTGCVFGDGSSTCRDNSGKTITVPSGYFKALLYYNRANTFGIGGYSAAGFYLEHRTYSETNVDKSMSMSIDELEELTGIDFFVNLSSKIGEANAARVEAEDPSSVSIWW